MKKTVIAALLLLSMMAAMITGPLYINVQGAQAGMEDKVEENMEENQYLKPPDEELRKKLTELQYYVTQEAGTERPFQNEYWNFDEPGIYVDIVSGEPLFSSKDKYQSSCGWPAFTEGLKEEALVEKSDLSFGRVRTEVRSRAGDSHLGHVFQNDPESPNGVRYCINSASLRFIPYEQMEEEGYGEWMDEVKKAE